MILREKHIRAQEEANSFLDLLSAYDATLITYPLEYEKLKLAISERFDILIEEIHGLTVREVKDHLDRLGLPWPSESVEDDTELSGFFYSAEPNARFIFLDASDNEERKKFSLLHEVCHFLKECFWSYHRDQQPVIAMRCTSHDLVAKCNTTTSTDKVVDDHGNFKEWVCNWFAAEVLMPVQDIADLEKSWKRKKMSKDQVADCIKSQFQVSRSAAGIRTIDLKIGQRKYPFKK